MKFLFPKQEYETFGSACFSRCRQRRRYHKRGVCSASRAIQRHYLYSETGSRSRHFPLYSRKKSASVGRPWEVIVWLCCAFGGAGGRNEGCNARYNPVRCIGVGSDGKYCRDTTTVPARKTQ